MLSVLEDDIEVRGAGTGGFLQILQAVESITSHPYHLLLVFEDWWSP